MHTDIDGASAAQVTRLSSWVFKMLLGLSALFIAGCSAFFSVRGLGLLFIGSATAVMVMAASLEVGKLVAASFLYRYWRHITIPLRIYLTLAVLLLIGITSLGNYGYLARAYEQTHSRIGLFEEQIKGIQEEMDATQRQIDASKGQLGKVSDNGREDRDKLAAQMPAAQAALDQSLVRLEERRKAAKDKLDRDIQVPNSHLTETAEMLKKGLASEDEAIAKLNERVAVLDRAVDAYTAQGGPGFLKHDGIRKGQLLREQQMPERTSIAQEIADHQKKQDQMRADHTKMMEAINQETAGAQTQYREELSRLDAEEQALRKAHGETVAGIQKQIAALSTQTTTVSSQGQNDVTALYQKMQMETDEISRLRTQIAGTDIGSYRFVARAFNTQADDLVKWLVLLLVLVFDPLAVTLTVGFNVALLRDRRARLVTPSTGAPLVNGDGVVVGRPGTSTARRRLVALGALTLVAVLIGGGVMTYKNWGPGLQAQWAHWNQNTHARLVPGESFAVLALHPSLLGSAATDHTWHEAVSGLLGKSAMVELVNLFGNALDGDSDIYTFIKYPSKQPGAQGQNMNPVMLCGLVARIKDPALAEAGLYRFADALADSLRPPGTPAVTPIHAMVRYGQGRYLDPQNNFMSFALTEHEVIVLLEIDGDPAKPTVENEIRLALAAPENSDSLTAGSGRNVLPVRALAKDTALSLWFDAGRCFADMPKNSAAQARYQQLQSRLNFDLLLTVNPTTQGQLAVVADYAYANERFKNQQEPTITDILQKLGSAEPGGIPGRLIDRCAVSLDMDQLMDHMQSLLTGRSGAQVRMEKSISSTRDGRFELIAQYDPHAGFPLENALRSLVH